MQTRLADLGLTLLPDGTIEETTAEEGRRTVPNVHVLPDGQVMIQLLDGATVTVAPDDRCSE